MTFPPLARRALFEARGVLADPALAVRARTRN